MIAHLTGHILHAELDWLILSVQGVGYEVHIPLGTAGALSMPAPPEVSLWIHTSVREDAIQLFGFATREERRLFRRLLAVNGVGPRLGLAILSELSPLDVVAAVHGEDVKTFTRVSGIGKKTAQRLILELKSSLDDFAWSPGQVAPRTGTFEDLRSALLNLGFPPSRIEDALSELKEAADPSEPLDALLRQALKMIS
jgi:holliday junction DNA helicase RuvA